MSIVNRLTAGMCSGAAALALLIAAEPGAAQAVPVTRLGDPEVRYARDFTILRSLRPLSDGRAIAVEGVGGEVVLLSADGQEDVLVGAHGQGPSEYMEPQRVLPVGDSDVTLIVDETLQRLLIVLPTGQIAVSEPWRLPIGSRPQGRDGMEGVYYDDAGLVRMGSTGQVIEGPAPLLRVLPGEAPDTVALVTVYELAARWDASPVSRMFSPGPNGVARFALDRSPFGAQDQWVLAGDGRIVIARARPYRIEIIPPGGGQSTEGPVIDYEPVRVTGADRAAFIEGLGRGRTGGPMSFSGEAGGRQAIPPPQLENEDLGFPAVKPPFALGAVHVSPRGEILVQRAVAANADHALLDVFDGQGRLVRQLELPAGRTLVGAGPGTVFTIHYDEFDLQILERFQMN